MVTRFISIIVILSIKLFADGSTTELKNIKVTLENQTPIIQALEPLHLTIYFGYQNKENVRNLRKANFSFITQDKENIIAEHKILLANFIQYDKTTIQCEAIIFFDYINERFIFNQNGEYTIKLKVNKEIESQAINLLVKPTPSGTLQYKKNIQKLLSIQQFLQVIYLHKSEDEIGFHIANFIIKKHPNTHLAKYLNVCIAIHEFDKLYETKRNKAQKNEYMESHRALMKSIDSFNIKNYLHRKALFKAGLSLLLAKEYKQSELIFSSLIEKNDSVSKDARKALDEIKMIHERLKE